MYVIYLVYVELMYVVYVELMCVVYVVDVCSVCKLLTLRIELMYVAEFGWFIAEMLV